MTRECTILYKHVSGCFYWCTIKTPKKLGVAKDEKRECDINKRHSNGWKEDPS